MSRFSDYIEFTYQTNGSDFSSGTIVRCEAGQMPQYPFEEFRISDKQTYRNLDGVAYTFQNYNKVGYRLNWTYLDESKANQLRLMIDANPYIVFSSNGTLYGTFIFSGEPSLNEVQFEMYDINFELQQT